MKEKEKKVKEKKQKPEESNKESKKDLVKVKEKKNSNAILRKWLANTSLTVLLIAIIILMYIVINLLIEKWGPSDIDLTENKVYSLSETSETIINNVEQDVEIMLINVRNNAEWYVINPELFIDLTYRYSKLNEKIKITEIDDISKEVELANKYNLTDTSIMIIIQSGERENVLYESDLYTLDYTTYEYKDTSEESMTNAILDVTITEKPKIYYLIGHNKYSTEYIQNFVQDLTEEANEVEALDILTRGEVPEDASTLMITTLSEDITEFERDAILDYIKNGGRIIIFSDSNVGKLDWKNFQKVLDEYGVSISEGIIVEQDSNKMLVGSPSAILVTVNSSSSITKQTNMNMSACFMNSGKLTFKDSEELEELGVEVETLATTSDTAFYRDDLTIESTSKQKDDEEGSVTVGALLTKKIDEDKTSKLIIYSNNMFITDVEIVIGAQTSYYALDFYNNEDLALNSISYLTERDDTIIIRKSYDEVSPYTVTEAQQNIVLAIIFAVPALIVIIGIIVWQARRRKK